MLPWTPLKPSCFCCSLEPLVWCRCESGRSCPASPQKPFLTRVLFNCLLLVFWGCISSVQQSSWPIISSRSLALLSGWDTDLMQQAQMHSVGMLPRSICFLGLIFFSIYLCVCLGCWDKVYFSPGWLHTHANLFSSLLVSPGLLFLPDSTSWVYASRHDPLPRG